MKKLFKPYGITSLILLAATMGIMGLLWSGTSHAGKHAYPDLIDQISYEVIEIMIKNGMPVRHDREDPWFRNSAIPGSYTLIFYSADEVPDEVTIETIRLCMNLYEERNRMEKFRILMYRETAAEKHRWFSGVKPFFELTIGGNN